jgi:hypothetical protein
MTERVYILHPLGCLWKLLILIPRKTQLLAEVMSLPRNSTVFCTAECCGILLRISMLIHIWNFALHIKTEKPSMIVNAYSDFSEYTFGGFIKGILRGVRCTKSLRVLFLHRRPPSWTTLVLYSRAVFIFNEPAYRAEQVS